MLRFIRNPLRIWSATSQQGQREQGSIDTLLLLALVAYFVMGASYFILRFGGYWAETDSAQLALAIRAVEESGKLIPATGKIYPSGYGYAAVSNVLMAFTGLSVSALQQLAYPLLSALIILPAWAFYKELTGNRLAATLATILMVAQPEFLFVLLRGSHERVSRSLIFVCLWLLVRSFRFRDRPKQFALHVAFFYLAAFGLVATNSLFGMSFVVAIATGMAVAWLCSRLMPSFGPIVGVTAGRLALVTLATSALSFIFIFYVYPPAIHGLQAMNGIVDRLYALFLTTETAQAGANPYGQVSSGWTSLPVYFLVSISDYLLIAITGPIWLWQGVRWLRGTQQQTSTGAWLLWLLYGAFALQGALAIISDFTGLMGANLQHRSFPSFAMLATPLLANVLVQRRPAHVWERTAVGGILALLAVLALVKATNEPGLSNKWMFYTPVEMRALEWVDQHDSYAFAWVGLDERLSSAYLLVHGRSERFNNWDEASLYVETRTYVISDIVRLQSARFGRPLPVTTETNIIYDSGAVQIYRQRPETPFQR